jgi:hypothetical protein
MDTRISQLPAKLSLQNNDVFAVVSQGSPVTNKVTLQIISEFVQANLTNVVTSVGVSVPTGFSVTNSPVTNVGTIVIGFAAGYSLPTTAKQTEWDNAYLYVSGQRTDYDYNIIGVKDGINNIFVTTNNFVAGSTKIYRNGLRMTRGVGYDYNETGANQITFTQAPDSGDLLIIDYIKN